MFFTIFLFVYIYKRGHISKVLGLLLAGAMLAFPVFVLLVIAAEMDVGVLDALKAIAIRAFYDPAESIYYYFEIFPATMDYLFGRSIGKLAWLMGWEYFDVPNYVHIYRFPRGILSGSANAGFIANLNADFGLFGVALGGFSVGLLMQVIQISIFRRKKTILGLAIYSFLVFAFFLLNFAALPVVLLSNGVIVALMVPSAIRIFESFLKKAIQRQGRTEYGIQR
jgi:hypothetical protein